MSPIWVNWGPTEAAARGGGARRRADPKRPLGAQLRPSYHTPTGPLWVWGAGTTRTLVCSGYVLYSLCGWHFRGVLGCTEAWECRRTPPPPRQHCAGTAVTRHTCGGGALEGCSTVRGCPGCKHIFPTCCCFNYTLVMSVLGRCCRHPARPSIGHIHMGTHGSGWAGAGAAGSSEGVALICFFAVHACCSYMVVFIDAACGSALLSMRMHSFGG